jgi:hypothetical protein
MHHKRKMVSTGIEELLFPGQVSRLKKMRRIYVV